MSYIIGIEYCKLDNNGRFKLPIAIKRQIEGDDNRFVIKPSFYANCLELWTYANFEAEIAQLQKELNPYSIEDRAMMRRLTAGKIIDLDVNDRLLIPIEMRSRINSSKDLIIQSSGKFMEIWDSDTYRQMNDDLDSFAAKVDERLGRVAHVPEV